MKKVRFSSLEEGDFFRLDDCPFSSIFVKGNYSLRYRRYVSFQKDNPSYSLFLAGSTFVYINVEF